MSDYENPTMFLIYPGMNDFEEVEITRETAEPGYCYVRPFGNDDPIKVHTSRLVDRETATARKSTRVIERDGYTVTETTVKGI